MSKCVSPCFMLSRLRSGARPCICPNGVLRLMYRSARLVDTVRLRNSIRQREQRECVYELLNIHDAAKIEREVEAPRVNGVVMVSQLVAQPVLNELTAFAQSTLRRDELEPDRKLPVVSLGLGF